MTSIIPKTIIEKKILMIRSQRVILDYDLAALFEVKTKRLNEQVKRNRDRFPDDFMFELTQTEKNEVVAICDHLSPLKFTKVLPKAFTEHGILQVANVLNSPRAIQVSIQVIRLFNELRKSVQFNQALKDQLQELEHKMDAKFEHTDHTFKFIFEMLNQLLYPPEDPKKIGFLRD